MTLSARCPRKSFWVHLLCWRLQILYCIGMHACMCMKHAGTRSQVLAGEETHGPQSLCSRQVSLEILDSRPTGDEEEGMLPFEAPNWWRNN